MLVLIACTGSNLEPPHRDGTYRNEEYQENYGISVSNIQMEIFFHASNSRSGHLKTVSTIFDIHTYGGGQTFERSINAAEYKSPRIGSRRQSIICL